ncbi:helix-turn-helix domain-containing protein [Variovorax paradoxus]|uniref:Helix-turn-helix domain-containing protein n=1 Tax=Variovorax paradoxus TaxID=34073 RepID=A0A5Q0M603_VARPD|nr:IclR family transcriptional regulator [Variovorax paradoxus]QFZ85081.1 helix-turn-helix domain-containing protein [Variovorax paradoxus]
MPKKPQVESVADAHAAPGGAAAVDRALTLLSAFRHGDRALSLTELAERTQLYKSTVLRLLASLEHAGLLQRQRDDGRYALGPEVARLHAIYAASFSLDAVVMPVLRALTAATGESAAYHVRQKQGDAWVRLCMYRVDSPNMLRDHVRAGDLLPADRGAGARVLNAFSESSGSESPADRKLFARIRAEGFVALVGDRNTELGGVSAPVFHADGSLAGAVTLTMPAHRFNRSQIEPVREAAARLSGMI